jgi:hypothetical protein
MEVIWIRVERLSDFARVTLDFFRAQIQETEEFLEIVTEQIQKFFQKQGRPPDFRWGGFRRRVWESNPALQRDRLAY